LSIIIYDNIKDDLELAEASEEGHSPRRAVEPMVMMMMIKDDDTRQRRLAEVEIRTKIADSNKMLLTHYPCSNFKLRTTFRQWNISVLR
jgi:hypothetical protein